MTSQKPVCPACGAERDDAPPVGGGPGPACCSACGHPAASADTRASPPPLPANADPPPSELPRETPARPPPRLPDDSVGGFATQGPSAPDAALNWQEGTLVADRFRIVRFVGQGGMGKVFLAQDETLARPIALKCVPQEILFDGDARDDLRQEASRLLDLAHDNIVRIHTYYDGPTWPFFAMEYLQGPTVKKLLRDRKHASRPLSVEEALLIARQVGQGLAHAHAKGVIHRDLKPGNLMLAEVPGDALRPSDVVKITDFGVSRVVADSTLRQTGKRSGTLPYMSPEQFRGEPCTVESDIYSFACTLHEVLHGQPPFHTGEIGYQILHVAPAPLGRGVPAAVRDAILRGLSKQPADRFRSVDAFVQALHGESRPVRRPAAAWVAMAALLALAATLMLKALPEPRGQEPVPQAAARPLVQPAPSEAQNLERDDLLRRLREELGKQIPAHIGRELADKMPSAPGTASFRFRMSEKGSSSFQRSLLERLVLQHTGDEPSDEKGEVPGTMVEGAKVFDLKNLKEGWHSVRAFLTRADGSGAELALDSPHKFRVDLTPPSFEVVPVRPDAFIDANPPLRSTFFEAVDFKLESTGGVSDIAEAYTSLSFGDAAMPWVRLNNQPEWRMERLPPGVTTTHRIYATDAAGNRSAALEVSVRRLKLEIDSFGLALPEGVAGNLATVTGLLRVEGDQSPTLRYFVKDLPVVPQSVGTGLAEAELATGGLWRDPTGVPFSAVLRLPSAGNTIEVRFAWKDNPPQPFARPMRINDVKVRAPRLAIDELPRRTAVGRVRIAGSLDPYFDGLELGLERKGRGSQRLGLLPSGMASLATFAQEVELVEGENTFLVSFFYGGDPLITTQKTFSIYSDKVPPGLEGPLYFERAGDELFVTIRPSEDLVELRVQEAASGQDGMWRTLQRDPGGRTYTYTFPIPFLPRTLRLEMTDLAGLVGRSEHLCAHTRADLEGVDLNRLVRSQASSPGSVVPAVEPDPARASPPHPAAPADLPNGATLIASPFVRDMDVEMVPFGGERLEISRAELSERVWYLFLAERGHGFHGTGDAHTPMVLMDHSPEILDDLAAWFEARSNDGYRYSIPTQDEWLMAMAGVGDVDRARESIRLWFRNGVKEPAASRLSGMALGVQEVVRAGNDLRVIGGTAADASQPAELAARCLEARPYDLKARSAQGRTTGARLVRRPK